MPTSFKLYPVRCFTCGKPIGHLEKHYNDLLTMYPDISKEQIYDMLELDLYCCRIHFNNYSNIYHNVEDKNVVDGIFPPDGGPSYIDNNDKISIQKEINKYKNINVNFLQFDWDTTIEKEEKEEKEKPKAKANKKAAFNLVEEEEDSFDLPEIEQVKNEDNDEIDFESLQINEYEEEDKNKIPIPTRIGLPIIINSEHVLKNDKFKMITVGYESDSMHGEMKTKIIEGSVYLAE